MLLSHLDWRNSYKSGVEEHCLSTFFATMNSKKTYILFSICLLFPALHLYAQTQRSAKAAPSDSVLLLSKNGGANRPAIYTLRFALEDSIRRSAELTILFPAIFDLSALEIAGSTDVDGGLKLTKQGQRVTVSRTGRGRIVPPGTPVEVKLGLIKILQPPGDNNPAKVTFYPQGVGKKQIERQVRFQFSTR